MKFREEESIAVNKLLREKGFEDEYHFVKRKGWVHIQGLPIVISFHRKSTSKLINSLWIETDIYSLKINDEEYRGLDFVEFLKNISDGLDKA